jgi:hypothetical protein
MPLLRAMTLLTAAILVWLLIVFAAWAICSNPGR